jgi:hypothetical protein
MTGAQVWRETSEWDATAVTVILAKSMLNISIPVDQSPWVGMEAHLNDEAYKTTPPKLIIWEIPERELRSPPSAKFRDARYQIDHTEWQSRIAALLA